MKYYFQIARHLTALKIFNAIKVLGSFYWSRLIRKPASSGFPISMSIEPTTACNLGCPQCPSGLKKFTRPTGNLKFELFQKIIDEVKNELIYLTMYFQGEPFIHPSFSKMIKYASDNGIFTATSTNAHFLTKDNCEKIIESGLGRLIISMDGVDQENYEKYRVNGQLDVVIEGIKQLVSVKKATKSPLPFIELQFIIFSHNEHQVPEIKRLARQWGVDKLSLKTAQIYDYQESSDFIPTDEKYSRYKKTSLGYQIKNKLYNHCWRMWHSCVITWDGRVVPCCFDKDATFIMGEIKQHPFKSIWNSDTYRKFRHQILTKRKEISICTNCTEGTKVWI